MGLVKNFINKQSKTKVAESDLSSKVPELGVEFRVGHWRRGQLGLLGHFC